MSLDTVEKKLMLLLLKMMIWAQGLFTLVISESCVIQTSLISLLIGACDMCVFNILQETTL